MSRRHRIKGSKSPVQQILVTPEVKERKILLNPETNEYEPTMVVTPAVYKQGKALQPTQARGKNNKALNGSTGTKIKKGVK